MGRSLAQRGGEANHRRASTVLGDSAERSCVVALRELPLLASHGCCGRRSAPLCHRRQARGPNSGKINSGCAERELEVDEEQVSDLLEAARPVKDRAGEPGMLPVE